MKSTPRRLRLPVEIIERLQSISDTYGIPQNRLVVMAIEAQIGQLEKGKFPKRSGT